MGLKARERTLLFYYASALLYGTVAGNTHKLQCTQTLSCVVLPRYGSASSRLSLLYWLPVHSRIQFKTAVIKYKVLTSDLLLTLE